MSDYICGATRPTTPGAPARSSVRADGRRQIAFNVRVLAPGDARPARYDDPWPQPHDIEEIYFVVDGEITIKLGDDVLTLGPRDAC